MLALVREAAVQQSRIVSRNRVRWRPRSATKIVSEVAESLGKTIAPHRHDHDGHEERENEIRYPDPHTIGFYTFSCSCRVLNSRSQLSLQLLT